MRALVVAGVLLLGIFGAVAHARDFRSIQPIVQPDTLQADKALITAVQPVPRDQVIAAALAVADAWNSGALDPLVADSFFAKPRLLDTITEVVPDNAYLRVLGVQAVSTLEQHRDLDKIVSIVSVVVRSQIEFHDPVTGFQQVEGTGEWFFQVEEEVPVVDHSKVQVWDKELLIDDSLGEAETDEGGLLTHPGILDSLPAGSQNLMESERPVNGDQPRITGLVPNPAIVGNSLTLSGENLATRGTVTLDLAGLSFVLPDISWSESEVVVELSDEMESIVGPAGESGRIWLRLEGEVRATSELLVVRDPASFTPIILSAPLSVHPGVEINITGEYFLDSAGSVTLECPGGGVSTEIVSWGNTSIRVVPAASFSRRLPSADCELVVRNGNGLEGRRLMYLDVELVRDNYGESRSHDFCGSPGIFTLHPYTLLNGWQLVDVSFTVTPSAFNERFFWIEAPIIGQSEIYGLLEGETGTGHVGRPCGTREIEIEYEVEGPRGLPFDTHLEYPDW